MLGKPLNETVNPDEVVALGAAVQAGILAGEITDLILLDVTPLSLGVETMGGLMTTIINRNASIPVKQSEVFSTGVDNQDSVEIHVLQGERPFSKDNKSLGIFKLNAIPSAPRGVPKINVTFQLDVNGLLSVSAREETSGQEQSIKIEGASTLARDEVVKMIEDAESNALRDKSKKSIINITYEFDNLLNQCEILLESETFIGFDAIDYCEELMAETSLLYKNNSLSEISSSTKDFKSFFNFILLEFIKNKISKSRLKTSGKFIDAEIVDSDKSN